MKALLGCVKMDLDGLYLEAAIPNFSSGSWSNGLVSLFGDVDADGFMSLRQLSILNLLLQNPLTDFLK